jgi:hypothetical protein
MWKWILTSVAAGNPWEWLTMALGAVVIFGAVFGAGYETAAKQSFRAVSSVAKAQEKQDVKTHAAAVTASRAVTAADLKSDARARTIVQIIHDAPPQKTCEVPTDVIRLLNDAGHY